MRHRIVAAGSVAVLLLSVSALVAAVRARLDAPSAAVPPPAVAPPAVAPLADPASGEPAPRRVKRPSWRAVLTALDRRRAQAYAAGDADRLGEVYVAGSSALRRDRALLATYRRRGLRVVGLRMRLVHVEPERTHREAVALTVRERVAGGVVVGPGVRRRLPVDEPDTRLVTLRRVPGEGWRVAAVRR